MSLQVPMRLFIFKYKMKTKFFLMLIALCLILAICSCNFWQWLVNNRVYESDTLTAAFMYTGLSQFLTSTTKVARKKVTKADASFVYNYSDHCVYYKPRYSNGQFGNDKAKWMRKCAMTIVPIGRLGNLMGQYATLKSLAIVNGRPAFVMPEMAIKLRKYFKITLPTLNKKLQKSANWTITSLDDWMVKSYTNFSGQYIKLQGYPCSWTFFHHIRSQILSEFEFHDDLKAAAQKQLHAIRGNRTLPLTFVGVHVRRGDYYHLMKYHYHGALANSDFFQKATDYFRNKYSNVVFIVASDDMIWCKSHIDKSKGDVYFLGNTNQSSPADDMALLSHCNHSIITIGTYGFWIAYLTGGETVYLYNYTWPDSPFLNVFKYTAFYLPQWIPIPANLTHWD